MAQRADIGEATISRLEAGKVYPYPGWKKRLERVLGVPGDELFQEVRLKAQVERFAEGELIRLRQRDEIPEFGDILAEFMAVLDDFDRLGRLRERTQSRERNEE